ncbi:hypothetical protein N0V86_002526 [Didymella sp. IMI 355093]|nr:hypothetical protein N0V86_002526 [Didymella sp. IMI 355093]
MSSSFNVWDMMVTLFHTISPETLRNSLDGTKDEFKAGEFQDHPNTADGVYEWENVVHCDIEDSGTSKIKYSSFGLYTKRVWSAVWDGQFTRESVRIRGIVFTNANDRNHIQVTIAKMIMSGHPWPADEFE